MIFWDDSVAILTNRTAIIIFIIIYHNVVVVSSWIIIILCLHSCKFLTSVLSRKDSGSDGLVLLFVSLCHLKERLDQLQRQCLNTSAQYRISHLHSQGSLR